MNQVILNLRQEHSKIIVNDQSNGTYDVRNEIICNIEVLKFNLWHYILVKGDITVGGYYGTLVAFKNGAPFIKCITKIEETITEDAEDLDLVMLMYNLSE